MAFFFFRLPRCKPPVPRKPSISPKPANLSRSPSAPTNQGDSMQRILQNLSVGNGNCNLAWNESSQETVFMNIYDWYLPFHDQKHSEQNITFVRLFLFLFLFLFGGGGIFIMQIWAALEFYWKLWVMKFDMLWIIFRILDDSVFLEDFIISHLQWIYILNEFWNN